MEAYKNLTVKLGEVIPVTNQERKPSEAEVYLAMHVEDADAKGDRCVLFTQREFDALSMIDSKDFAELLAPGRLYKMTRHDGQITYIVRTRVYYPNTKEWYIVIKRISEHALRKAEARAAANQEDQTKRNWFNRLLDR